MPDLDTDESTLRAPRVIAVIAEPAEAKPDQEVSYSALLVDGSGVRSEAGLAWFYCSAQKPLAELGPVDRECLDPSSGKLARIGAGLSLKAKLPTDACALFGPNLPPPMEGQLPGRPVDPDNTGGYKQPVMLGVNSGSGDDLVLYEQRILCDLPGVTPQLLLDYKLRYHANQNPQIETVEAQRADGTILTVSADDTLEVSAGEQLALSAIWPACPEADACGDGLCGAEESRVSCPEDCAVAQPKGCSGQERYLWFNTATRDLEQRRESLRVSWYATGGSYDDERTGVAESDRSGRIRNVWRAPSQPGELSLFLVLRDARGGTGFRQLKVSVQ